MGKFLVKVGKFLLSRPFWSLVFVLIQLAIIIFGPIILSQYFFPVYVCFVALSLIMVVWLMAKNDNPTYKLAWVIPIILFPIFGGLLYLAIGNRKAPRRFKQNILDMRERIEPTLPDDTEPCDGLRRQDVHMFRQADYLLRMSQSRVYDDTYTDFQAPGEVHFERLLAELEKAEKYIFMEYFIVNPGVMLDSILDVLTRKAAQGVDVRFIYDDFGSLMKAPKHFVERMEARGIQAVCFNRVHGYLRAFMNFRNHRKITVIDGKVGFTGGVNVADEYINAYERFGNWRDSAIELRGPGVWGLTYLFLETWNSIKNLVDDDLDKYKPDYDNMLSEGTVQELGYIIPFGDSPFDDEPVGENVYRQMIDTATKSIYITTPYLIVDNELMSSMEIAARSGVDVKIIVPHIPDKKLVFLLTQAHYKQLLKAGVEIYEYTPGFLHTKGCIIDGVCATTGTINFDYRSLYLHFECGVWMYKTPAVRQYAEEFQYVLDKSDPVTLEDIAAWSPFKRILQVVTRFLAPLL